MHAVGRVTAICDQDHKMRYEGGNARGMLRARLRWQEICQWGEKETALRLAESAVPREPSIKV
jgi:hypothetical protein